MLHQFYSLIYPRFSQADSVSRIWPSWIKAKSKHSTAVKQCNGLCWCVVSGAGEQMKYHPGSLI